MAAKPVGELRTAALGFRDLPDGRHSGWFWERIENPDADHTCSRSHY